MKNVVEKIKMNIPCSVLFFFFFFPKIVPLMRCVEKYGIARHSTDCTIIQHMCLACCITKATKTQSEYVILLSSTSGYTKAPHCYIIGTLPAL